jgi:hypothetical protein
VLGQSASSTNRALPGLIHVGLPVAPAHSVAVGVGGSVGVLDQAQNSELGSRLGGNLAASFSPGAHWSVGLDFSGYRDRYGAETNGYGEPRLTGRYVDELSVDHHWGLQIDARLVGAEVPSIDFSATSPSLRGLYGFHAGEDVWVGAELGFHLNRTAAALPNVAVLSANDRRSLGASTWNGLPWGMGAGYRLLETTSLLGEVGGEWLVGGESPGFGASPIRVSLGLQQWFGSSFLATAGADVAVSGRAELARDQISVEEPRVLGFVGLTWVLANPEPPPPPPAIEPAPKPAVVETPKPAPAVIAAPPAPIVSPVSGTIVDEGGRPLADVAIVLEQEGQPARTERTFADGHYDFAAVPEGTVTLKVVESGFDDVTVNLEKDGPRNSEIVMRPAVPAGQVRGKVLDLQGNPVAAQVTITTEATKSSTQQAAAPQTSVVAADGSFELDLAPGRYVVRFEHADFAPQRRNIVVKDKGVVILNIALIR